MMGLNEKFTSADQMTRDMLEDQLETIRPMKELVDKVYADIGSLNLGDRRPTYRFGMMAIVDTYAHLMQNYRYLIDRANEFEQDAGQMELDLSSEIEIIHPKPGKDDEDCYACFV